jgi:hypothetical protein
MPASQSPTAHASLSPEGQIQTGLHAISCSQRQFAEIAACMDIPVSGALISLCLSGKREFTPWTAEKLLNLLSELLALRDYFKEIPINWSSYEKVATLIVTRRMQQADAEVHATAAS